MFKHLIILYFNILLPFISSFFYHIYIEQDCKLKKCCSEKWCCSSVGFWNRRCSFSFSFYWNYWKPYMLGRSVSHFAFDLSRFEFQQICRCARLSFRSAKHHTARHNLSTHFRLQEVVVLHITYTVICITCIRNQYKTNSYTIVQVRRGLPWPYQGHWGLHWIGKE